MLVLGLVTRPPADAPARISSLAGRRPTVVWPAVWRCLTAASILLCLALPASRAEAHAVPAAMDPAPDARLDAAPPAVVIRFTERVEPHTSSLEVLDAKGARVSRGEGAVDPADPWRYRVPLGPLPPGAYTVSWRVLSADDGHVTSGAHVFTVGVAGPVEQSGPTVRSGGGWRPLARWLVALGGALLLGALVGGPLLGLAETRWIRGMEGLGVMAVAVGGTLDLVLQARALAGARSTVGVLGTLLVTPPGLVWLVRSGLLALLAILLTAGASRMGARRLRLGVAVLVVMLGGLVTHGAALADGRWLALSAEMLHLLAVTAWAGGLLAFGTVFWRASASALRRGDCPPRARDAGLLGARRARGGAPLGERALPRPAPPRRVERAPGHAVRPVARGEARGVRGDARARGLAPGMGDAPTGTSARGPGDGPGASLPAFGGAFASRRRSASWRSPSPASWG